MTNVNDILARLQKGESADDIATEFANMINDAIKLNDAENQKQKAAQEREDKLNGYAHDIAAALAGYVSVYDPKLAAYLTSEDLDIADIAGIRSTLDTAIAAAQFAMTLEGISPKTSTPDPKAKKTPDDAISQFLKNFGL
jgi:hypothetical protein